MRKATLFLLLAAASGCSTVIAGRDKYLSSQIDNLDRRLRHLEDRVAQIETGTPAKMRLASAQPDIVEESRSLSSLEPMDLALTSMSSASYSYSLPASTSTSSSKPSDPFTRDVQKALKEAGYDPGPLDGRMGALTKAALERFQRANKLRVTGSTTRATWRLLKRYL